MNFTSEPSKTTNNLPYYLIVLCLLITMSLITMCFVHSNVLMMELLAARCIGVTLLCFVLISVITKSMLKWAIHATLFTIVIYIGINIVNILMIVDII